MGRLTALMAAALTCAVVAISADLFRRTGLNLYTEQYMAGLLAVAMPLVYMSVPAGAGRTRAGAVPWYDMALAALSFVAAVYAAARFPALSEQVSSRPWDGLVVAGALLLLLLEGLRRTTGLALMLVTAGFLALALTGAMLPGELAARSIPFGRLVYFSVWDSSAAFGLPLKIVATVVVIYVLFGQVLLRSGGSKFFTDFSIALMGRRRGGPAKIAIVGSSLFGTISGSTVANVLTVGVVTIPLMKRAGFKPHSAAAIEATASTGGQLMPPVMGVAAFIMAEFLQVPYSSVALAATIPAVLFYVALFMQTDLEAARAEIPPMDPATIPRLSHVLRAGWYFPIPFVVLIYVLFWEGAEPERAGLMATASALLLAVLVPFEGKRVGLRDLYEMLEETGRSVLELFMIGAAAGIIIGTLNYSGLGFSVTLLMLHAAGGSMLALLAIAGAASIILGMGMPTVGVYILLATLIAPSLVEMGVDPMAAHMFIMYYGCLSMITPPVAIGAFAAANIAGAGPMQTGFSAMRFGWTVFVLPFLFVFSGTLLMKGDPALIVIDTLAALLGIWLLSASLMRYSVRHLGFAEAVAYGAAGMCLLLPVEAMAAGRWINLVGLIAAGVLLARDINRKRVKLRPAAMPRT